VKKISTTHQICARAIRTLGQVVAFVVAVARMWRNVDVAVAVAIVYAVARAFTDLDVLVIAAIFCAVARACRAFRVFRVPPVVWVMRHRSSDGEGCEGKNGETEKLHVESKTTVFERGSL
jgi:hypothetical protein